MVAWPSFINAGVEDANSSVREALATKAEMEPLEGNAVPFKAAPNKQQGRFSARRKSSGVDPAILRRTSTGLHALGMGAGPADRRKSSTFAERKRLHGPSPP